MAFFARKPFLFEGVSYLPGDPIEGFPDRFFKSEAFIRAGFVVERKPQEVKAPVKKAVAKKRTTEIKSGV